MEGLIHEDAEEWCGVTEKAHEDCFAIRVKDDSKENSGGKKSIPEDAVIIVDPEAAYSSGSLVVARLEAFKEATFKRLVIDGEQKFLKPLNLQYRSTATALS